MSAVIEPVPWTAPPGAAPLRAGLGSRAELLATLAAAIPVVDPSRGPLLLALDVDDFRRFNAERGYAAGNLLLADLGGRLAGLGRAFALGADAFALVLDGSPEELWRRGAAALWSLDPAAGALALRCSFGAAVLVDPEADAVGALVLAEDRLADQRNRAQSVAERYGELILAILRAQQPETSEHALDVAELAAGVAARLGVDPLDRALVRAAELHDVGKIGSPARSSTSPGRSTGRGARVRGHTAEGEALPGPPRRCSAKSAARARVPRALGRRRLPRPRPRDPAAARIVCCCDAYDAMTTDRHLPPGDARPPTPAASSATSSACSEVSGCWARRIARMSSP